MLKPPQTLKNRIRAFLTIGPIAGKVKSTLEMGGKDLKTTLETSGI